MALSFYFRSARCESISDSTNNINTKKSGEMLCGSNDTNLSSNSKSQPFELDKILREEQKCKEISSQAKYCVMRVLFGFIPGCVFSCFSLIMMFHLHIVSGCLWALFGFGSFCYQLQYLNPEDQDWRKFEREREKNSQKKIMKLQS